MDERDSATVLIAEKTQESEDTGIGESLVTLPLAIRRTSSAEGVMRILGEQIPDLIVSEVWLPDASGFSLCRRIREDAKTAGLPVILVSAWNSEMDRILAFECGADDFVSRPYFARELASRVEAILRRRHDARDMNGAAKTPDPERPGAASKPGAIHVVRVSGQRVDLTPKEISILSALVGRTGHVCSRRELVEHAWPREAMPAPRTIDSHLKTLRRKLGAAGDCLVTVRGVGYRFRPHAELSLESNDDLGMQPGPVWYD